MIMIKGKVGILITFCGNKDEYILCVFTIINNIVKQQITIARTGCCLCHNKTLCNFWSINTNLWPVHHSKWLLVVATSLCLQRPRPAHALCLNQDYSLIDPMISHFPRCWYFVIWRRRYTQILLWSANIGLVKKQL